MGLLSENELNQSVFSTSATRLSLTTSPATTAALASGLYLLTCDQDCRILQGDDSVTVSATTGFPLWAKTYFGPVKVDLPTNAYIAGIVTAGTATLELIPVEE